MVSLEDQLEDVINDPELTEEKRQEFIENIEYLIAVRDGTYAEPAALSPNYGKFLEVPFCKQDYKNYCGSTTTLQTYKYFNKKPSFPNRTSRKNLKWFQTAVNAPLRMTF